MKKLLLFLVLFLTVNSFAQTFVANQSVLIQWEGKWFPGKILEIKDGSYLISYDNFDASWNEVVGPDRLQTIAKEETPVQTESTASSESFDEKVKAMCECLEQAAASGQLRDKERCMDLKDAHKATFDEYSEEYGLYNAAIYNCKPGADPEATKSYDTMVKEVCDCFVKSKAGATDRYECFKLQSEHAGKFDDDESRRFVMETNECDK
ncbi:MAG: hypothetical protein QE487_01095 [Fluviicola sp.]|nr:hypothetical protein [Fluviicola sp.]